jgi:hypothetical protein
MKQKIALLIYFSFFLFSCTSENKHTKDLKIAIEKIAVNCADSTVMGNFKDFFKSSKLVALETKAGSIVGTIKRLQIYKGLFLILNKETNSVLVFDGKGKFVRAIGKMGNKTGEYNSLMDFAVNENEDVISLYSDRPYKLLTYKLDGKFLKEEYLNALYGNIAYTGNQLIFLNRKPENGYRVFVGNDDGSDKEGYLSMNKSDRVFKSYIVSTPYIVSSKQPYIFYPFCDTIFTAIDGRVGPKYVIDFGKNTMPANVFNKYSSGEQIFKEASAKNYGYRIGNFRETSDYITFSYNDNRIVIYSKKSKRAKSFDLAINDEAMPLQNYLAHDGNDNKFVTQLSAYDFKNQMELYHLDNPVWSKIPQELKHLNDNLTSLSNPLLVVSELN